MWCTAAYCSHEVCSCCNGVVLCEHVDCASCPGEHLHDALPVNSVTTKAIEAAQTQSAHLRMAVPTATFCARNATGCPGSSDVPNTSASPDTSCSTRFKCQQISRCLVFC